MGESLTEQCRVEDESLWVVNSFSRRPLQSVSLCGISSGFPELSHSRGQVSYVLLTRAPLSFDRSTCMC